MPTSILVSNRKLSQCSAVCTYDIHKVMFLANRSFKKLSNRQENRIVRQKVCKFIAKAKAVTGSDGASSSATSGGSTSDNQKVVKNQITPFTSKKT